MANLAVPRRRRRAGGGGEAAAQAPKQEKAVAARLGGHRVRGSGSGYVKGDVRVTGIARVELKSTTASSFRVTMDMIKKIEEAAASGGTEVPAIEIDMLDGFGRMRKSIAVIPVWALEVLIDAAKKS